MQILHGNRPLADCQLEGWKLTGEGDVESVPVEQAPKQLLELAVKSTSLIGNGLYGVDIKQSNNKFYIIEINDNPNLDEGVEDQTIKQQLYLTIMQEFMTRLT